MPSATDRIDFGPPRDTDSARAFALALLAHGLLIAALTWGLNWKSTDRSTSIEAELWSSVPQEAAPRLASPLPLPPPAPAEPAPKAPKAKAPSPPAPDPDIALAQEKKRKLQQQQKETEAQKAAENQKAEVLAKKEKDLKAKQELAEQEQDRRKALDDAKKVEAKKQETKEQSNSAALAAQRKQNLARLMGQAGASGAEDARGSALKASGPSATYGGKVRAKVKPNIVFTDDISGNPSAEVEVKTAPDGTIMSQRLVKPSGNKAWDDAVIKAIIRTETMPRDVDGRVPTPMTLVFTPKDP